MILVFGSINLDLVFPVQHLPAPGETTLGGSFQMLPGGKGANQALAAARDGGRVVLVGAVGHDAFAEAALDLVRKAGIDLSYLSTLDWPTGCASVVVEEGGDNQIAVASGANAYASASHVPDHLLGPGSTIVLQLEAPLAPTLAVARRAKALGGRVILNIAPARGDAEALLETIDVLVANEGEAATLGEPADLVRRHGFTLIVTRGEAGAIVYRPEGGSLAVPALPVVAVDTTGAGDCFVGVLSVALDRGIPMGAALRRATVAAGLSCGSRGAQPSMPSATMIDEALGGFPDI
jgi:ribokinase